jgi:hypothetical protein
MSISNLSCLLRRSNAAKPAINSFDANDKIDFRSVETEPVNLHWIWSETVRRLEDLLRRAREGKHVQEASEFARWLRMSGLIKLFQFNPAQGHLTVDCKVVEKLIGDILSECEDQWRSRNADAKYAASDIAEISRKLDIIAAQVAKFSPGSSLPGGMPDREAHDTAEAATAPGRARSPYP